MGKGEEKREVAVNEERERHGAGLVGKEGFMLNGITSIFQVT